MYNHMVINDKDFHVIEWTDYCISMLMGILFMQINILLHLLTRLNLVFNFKLIPKPCPYEMGKKDTTYHRGQYSPCKFMFFHFFFYFLWKPCWSHFVLTFYRRTFSRCFEKCSRQLLPCPAPRASPTAPRLGPCMPLTYF